MWYFHSLPLAPIMRYLFYISVVIYFFGCSIKTDNCKGKILDFEMNSSIDAFNKLFKYYETNTFTEIIDTNQLLRFEKSDGIAHFFQPSKKDSTTRKYIYKAKEAIIKMPNYQWDLLVQIDTDQEYKNIMYWLKSYDNNRNQIGHIDFAGWTIDYKIFLSGRIDCDSTIHIILKKGKEHRIFKTDDKGRNYLIDRIMQEK